MSPGRRPVSDGTSGELRRMGEHPGSASSLECPMIKRLSTLVAPLVIAALAFAGEGGSGNGARMLCLV